MKLKLFTLLFASVIFAIYSIYDYSTIMEPDLFRVRIDLFLFMFSIIGLAVFAIKMIEIKEKRNT